MDIIYVSKSTINQMDAENKRQEDMNSKLLTAQNYDNVIDIIGGRKLYSVLCLLIMMIVKICPGLNTLVHNFAAAKVDYTCLVNTNSSCQVSVTADNCNIVTNCSGISTVKPCDSFVYDTSVFKNTIVTRFDLVCNDSFLASLPSTIFFAGFLIGSSAYGVLADGIGRQISCVTALVYLCLFNVCLAVVPFYWLYVLFQFLCGTATGGVLTVLYIFSIESTNSVNRPLWGFSTNHGWTIGILLVTLISYLYTDYQVTLGIVAVIVLLPIPAVILIGESIRWLINMKQFKQADKQLKLAAKLNKIKLPETFSTRNLATTPKTKEQNNESFLTLFKTPGLRKVTLITWFLFTVVSMAYYGISLAVGSLGGNIFLNQVYSALVEPFARLLCIFASLKMGRKTLLAIAFLLSGVSLLVAAVLFEFPDLTSWRVASAMHGKFWITVAFEIIWLYAGEVFPTNLRSVGCGSGSTMARVGAMLSTVLGLLSRYWTPLPFLILGAGPLLGSIVILFMPETARKALPETVDDGEKLANSYSFTCSCKEKKKIYPIKLEIETD